MSSPTQPLWPDCPPLPPGSRLPRDGGGDGFKLLALEAQGVGLNLYRAFDLTASRRCPACANFQPANAERCLVCGTDLRDVAPGNAAVMLYESCTPGRLDAGQRALQSQVRHPHLLLPAHAQEIATTQGPARRYLALPENPAPAFADLPRPQSLLLTLRWGEQLAQALAALHGAGLVHGQIDQRLVRVREDRAWLVVAPGLVPPPPAPNPADDARDLARLLLHALGAADGPADLMGLPTPVREALTPALAGALQPNRAARALAEALTGATAALRQDAERRSAAGWASHPGRIRQGNEDSLLVVQMDVVAAGVRAPCGIYLLADGAGGHASGEVASQAAVQAAMAHLAGSLLPAAAGGRLPDLAALRTAAQAALRAANGELRRLREQGNSDMLTTAVLVLCVEQRGLVASAGDSRAYLLRNGMLSQLTEDHTLVARLVRMGQLTAAEARTHARRHQLYRALGQDDEVAVDLVDLTFQPGDLLLLCSDGLTEEVSDEGIAAIVAQAADLPTASRSLVEAANAAGGRDNVSVILARPW